MKKKDARILWNEEFDDVIGGSVITDLIVVEFNTKHKENWPRDLHEKYKNDLGNSSCWWEHMTLVEILIDFGFRNGFRDRTTSTKAINELAKIDEWSEEIRTFTNTDCKKIVASKV